VPQQWKEVDVQGRPARYLDVGHGRRTLVFLHGWGIGYAGYRPALARLAGLGVRVVAPAMPAFGGTTELPVEDATLAGYAEWAAEFVGAVDIDTPVTLVGHSFGGGVAIRLAFDQPELVERLVLVNSVGGASGGSVLHSLRDRPPWDWGLHLPRDLSPLRQVTRVVPVIVRGLVPNVRRNPRAVAKAAALAWRADLRSELAELRGRGLPIVILWGDADRLLPPTGLAAIRSALGNPTPVVVPGSHNWLLANPTSFYEVITNVVGLDVGPGAGAERTAS
jgi:pimeloyl-ACP methyl ester carboxylesterase